MRLEAITIYKSQKAAGVSALGFPEKPWRDWDEWVKGLEWLLHALAFIHIGASPLQPDHKTPQD
jgi:hypothetical protein